MDKMKWWREAKFGMFIHWGIYAASEGYWNDKETQGIGEWIQGREKIPLTEYRKLAEKMTLSKYNAAEWVEIAKNAGMKYIVITAKHHDGFAMYNSQCSGYNIVKMGPTGRDPLKELVDAVENAGLKMGIYYSHVIDWEHPDGARNDWDYDPDKKDFSRYFEEKCKPQIRELLTQYGNINVLWFDMPRGIKEKQALEIKELVLELQPNCIISGRIGHDLGDYESLGDNQAPWGKPNCVWETPGTMNDTWGYKRNDHNWKNPESMIELLADITAKGGNYLLNIGPTAEGEIPSACVKRLREIEEWIKVNSEAIYATLPNPFPTDFEWGTITRKDNRFFCFINNPEKPMTINTIKTKVTKCCSLAVKKDIPFQQTCENGYDELKISYSEADLTGFLPVIVLEFDSAPKIEPVIQPHNNIISLPAYLAKVASGEETDTKIKSDNESDIARLAENSSESSTEKMYVNPLGGDTLNWCNTSSSLSWQFNVQAPGKYKVILKTFGPKYGDWLGGHSVMVKARENLIRNELKADIDIKTPNTYYPVKGSIIGSIDIPSKGAHYLTLKAEKINPDSKHGLSFYELDLQKHEKQEAKNMFFMKAP